MEKTMKFKGQKVTITRDRVELDDRDADKRYYEIVGDNEQPHIPIMIVEEAEDDFWGTMIADEEFHMNNGDFHALSTDLGVKLAKAFGLME